MRNKRRGRAPLAVAATAALGTLLSSGGAHAQFSCPPADSTAGSVANKDWSLYGGNLQNHRCSESKIEADKLKLRWSLPLAGCTSTPASHDNVLYFGDWDGNLNAVQALGGAPVWSVKLGDQVRSSPAVDGDVVYASTQNALFAVDRHSGEVLWSTPVDSHPYTSVESSPVPVDGLVILGVASVELVFDLPDYTFRGSVVAFDATTGTEVWRVYTSENDATSGAGVSVWSSAAVDRDRKLLYIGTGNTYEAPASPLSDSVLAIDYELGTIVWQNQFTEGDIYNIPDGGPGGDFDVGATPTLLTVNGQDIVVVGSKAGIVKAMDRDTGDPVWEQPAQLGNGSPIGGVMVSAATDGETIYVNSNNWVTFSFVQTGQHHPLDTSTTYALDAATGEVLWERPLDAPAFGGIVLGNGVLYHGVINGNVYGLDAQTGDVVFETSVPGPVGAGLSIADKRLYVPYGFTFLYGGQGAPGGVAVFK